MTSANNTTSNRRSDTHYLNGTVVQYTCQGRYKILPEGNDKIVCNETGSWDGLGQLGACYSGWPTYFEN